MTKSGVTETFDAWFFKDNRPCGGTVLRSWWRPRLRLKRTMQRQVLSLRLSLSIGSWYMCLLMLVCTSLT